MYLMGFRFVIFLSDQKNDNNARWSRFRFNSLHWLTYTYVKLSHFIIFFFHLVRYIFLLLLLLIFLLFSWIQAMTKRICIYIFIFDVNRKWSMVHRNRFHIPRKYFVFFFLSPFSFFSFRKVSFVHSMSFYFNEKANELGLIIVKHTKMPIKSTEHRKLKTYKK